MTPDAPDAKRLAQQQFGAHAAAYVRSPTHRAGAGLEQIVAHVPLAPGQWALDVATGGGHTALALAQSGAVVVAGDLTRPMLLAAREHGAAQRPARRLRYVQLDAEALPFAGGAFDAAVCRIAPHHFPDVARFVRELARVVRPGGTVAVVDQLAPPDPQAARYLNAFERLRDPSHRWAYNLAEWRGFFSGAGLAVRHQETFAVPQELHDWAARMGADAPTVLRLEAMLRQAPAPVAAWTAPRVEAGGLVHFVIWHFLLVGVRGEGL